MQADCISLNKRRQGKGRNSCVLQVLFCLYSKKGPISFFLSVSIAKTLTLSSWCVTVDLQWNTHTVPDGITAPKSREASERKRTEGEACRASWPDDDDCNSGWGTEMERQRGMELMLLEQDENQCRTSPQPVVLNFAQADLMYLLSFNSMWSGRQRHRDGININPPPSQNFAPTFFKIVNYNDRKSLLKWKINYNVKADESFSC